MDTRPVIPRAAVADASPSPAESEVDAVLQAWAVHGLTRGDPAMPLRLRALLVLYAGDLLDRAGRSVELTPPGLAALAATGEAGPEASAPATSTRRLGRE